MSSQTAHYRYPQMEKPPIQSSREPESRDISPGRDLLERCSSGDRDAFRLLVLQLMKPAYFHALAITGNHEDAVDVSQEAFVKAWKAMPGFDPGRDFYPWYYTILKRLALNAIRNRKRRRETAVSDLPGWIEPRNMETPESHLEDRELSEKVQLVIAGLPPEDREILVLREMEGYTYREIAGMLGIPEGTVMSRLYAARQKFRSRMKETGYELT
jgi:RNA polymerase sigma-70 factor, ECF subfamily